MKRSILMVMMALVVLSCSNVVSRNDSDGYTFEGSKLIKWESPNKDTVIYYDWSPAELVYIGDCKYTYQGYPCEVDVDDCLDVFSEMDDLQSLNAEGIYSDTYYELLSVYSPTWIAKENKFILYHL